MVASNHLLVGMTMERPQWIYTILCVCTRAYPIILPCHKTGNTGPASWEHLQTNAHLQYLQPPLEVSRAINHGISKIHVHWCHVKQKYPQESSCWFVMQQEQTMASWSWSYLLYSKMWSPYPLRQGLKQTLKDLIVDCFHSGLVEPRFWRGPHGRWWGLIHWWTPRQIGDQHVLGGQQGARVWGRLAF